MLWLAALVFLLVLNFTIVAYGLYRGRFYWANAVAVLFLSLAVGHSLISNV